MKIMVDFDVVEAGEVTYVRTPWIVSSLPLGSPW